MASQLYEGDEKVALNEREDVQYDKNIILEREKKKDRLKEVKEFR